MTELWLELNLWMSWAFFCKGVKLPGAFRKAMTDRYNDLYKRLSGKD